MFITFLKLVLRLFSVIRVLIFHQYRDLLCHVSKFNLNHNFCIPLIYPSQFSFKTFCDSSFYYDIYIHAQGVPVIVPITSEGAYLAHSEHDVLFGKVQILNHY